MSDNALFQVRATRSNPPGRAGEEDRRKTYGAALAQFDELMTAARAAGPAARPLPLFYALSQAGRAIATAHLDAPWKLQGHGLTVRNLEAPLLDVAVRTHGEPLKDGRQKSFAGVAKATDSPVPRGQVTLRDLWSSLPEVFAFLHDPAVAVPLALVPSPPGESKLYDWSRVQACVIRPVDAPEDLQAHLNAHFPSAAGVEVTRAPFVPGVATVLTSHGYGIQVSWPSSKNLMNHIEALDRVAPGTALSARWMRPGVAGTELTPLMTWWMLLYGVSMLARYQPDGWVGALQYDQSEAAAGLAQLLDAACDSLPQVVLDGLNGERTAYPLVP